MTPLAMSAANGGVEEPSAYTSVERREAADIDAVGKYEPKLTENGIPADVLAKLLPGDDVIELEMPVVGDNLAYRFVKRAFDVVSCSCALIILAIPMGVIALKIKSESPALLSLLRGEWVRAGVSSTCTSFAPCTSTRRCAMGSGRRSARYALRQSYAQDPHG